MTLQISDVFYHDEKEYSLLYKEGDTLLFHPLSYGFNTYDSSSFCWKGHLSMYKLDNGFLTLDGLNINNKEKISINRVKPKNKLLSIFSFLKNYGKTDFLSNHMNFDYEYRDIGLKLNYTGEILIGLNHIDCDFDLDYYNYNYVASPHSFLEVLRLSFDNGALINITDISCELDELREDLQLKYKSTNQYSTIPPHLLGSDDLD